MSALESLWQRLVCWRMGHDWVEAYTGRVVARPFYDIASLRCTRCGKLIIDVRDWL